MAQNYKDNYVITCIGGPLDGTVVEIHDLPELGTAVLDYCTELSEKKVHHVYRCMMHPSHYGIRAYIYEGTRAA